MRSFSNTKLQTFSRIKQARTGRDIKNSVNIEEEFLYYDYFRFIYLAYFLFLYSFSFFFLMILKLEVTEFSKYFYVLRVEHFILNVNICGKNI